MQMMSMAMVSLQDAVDYEEEKEKEQPIEREQSQEQQESSQQNKIAIDQVVNGVRTSLPLLASAIACEIDQPSERLQEMMEIVKALSLELLPDIVDRNSEFAPQVYALRSMLIGVVSTAIEHGREDILCSEALKVMLETVTCAPELYSNTGLPPHMMSDYQHLKMHFSICLSTQLLPHSEDMEEITLCVDNCWDSYNNTILGEYCKTLDDNGCMAVIGDCIRPALQLSAAITKKEVAFRVAQRTANPDSETTLPLERAVSRQFAAHLQALVAALLSNGANDAD